MAYLWYKAGKRAGDVSKSPLTHTLARCTHFLVHSLAVLS